MQSILNLGADVDSCYVMVACAADSFKPHRIVNERKAIRAWLRTVPPGSRLAMESTGSYHEALADLAHEAGLQVFIVNARDLRRYGQGIGRRGKTDRLDAEVIARYIAREHQELHAYVPPTRAQRTLARLISRRSKLVQTKDSIRQSLQGLSALRLRTLRRFRALACSRARGWAIALPECPMQPVTPSLQPLALIRAPLTPARDRADAG